MFGTSSSTAVSAYVSLLQRAVHCITGEIVRAAGFRPSAQTLTAALARGEIVPLAGGTLPLGFRLRHFYRFVEDRDAPAARRWQVIVTDYFYTFVHRNTGRELLAFHLHPHIPEKSFPHVHLESGLGLHRDLVGIHVPTGEIALEDVIRFAIEELQVRPRVPGWAAVLERSRTQAQGQA